MYKKALAACLAGFFLVSAATAQKAEVTISLNEAFFDALLDSVYQNYDPPEFSVSQLAPFGSGEETALISDEFHRDGRFSLGGPSEGSSGNNAGLCPDTVRILREMNGVRTAVRFREGKLLVPFAFSGNYNPPFIGCVEFAGVAETNIDLEFDQAGQRLIGRAHVLNVNLNGSAGVGGTLIAKMIQGSIDKKLNPIEVFRLDKLSFSIPIQNTGSIRMKAISATPEIVGDSLNVRIAYEFLKG
ncbi:MAG: hypothetical protein ABJA02_12435 [Acidobacteriota bacterium]